MVLDAEIDHVRKDCMSTEVSSPAILKRNRSARSDLSVALLAGDASTETHCATCTVRANVSVQPWGLELGIASDRYNRRVRAANGAVQASVGIRHHDQIVQFCSVL